MSDNALARLLTTDPARVHAACVAEEARRSGSRSFAAFVKQAWHLIPGAGSLQWNPYLEGLSLTLEALARRRIKRLVGNGPPRNGKSNLFAILWPAWVWTWNPQEMFVFLSFSQDLVREHSVKCRDIVTSKWYRDMYRPRWDLATDTQDDFENTAGGRRIASTMKGAGVTGRGGNIIAIDDPLSAEEATSQAARDQAVRILEQVVLSRFNDPNNGVAAMMMQRVHYHDPTQWALKSNWTPFVAPLVKDERECVVHDDEGKEIWRDTRTPGDVLVPERFSTRRVTEIQNNLVLFATQYQQQPLEHVNAGMYFQRAWFKTLRAKPSESQIVRRCRSWDLASTEGDGDYTVGVKLALLDNGRFVVEDVVRGQWGPRQVRETIRATAEADGYDCDIVFPQDPGQAGKDQAQEYAVKLAGWTLHSRPQSGSKEVRAGGASSQVRAENVDLIAGVWNEPFLQTLEAFPDPSVHDDDVDAFANAVTHLAQKEKTQAELWEEMDL